MRTPSCHTQWWTTPLWLLLSEMVPPRITTELRVLTGDAVTAMTAVARMHIGVKSMARLKVVC